MESLLTGDLAQVGIGVTVAILIMQQVTKLLSKLGIGKDGIGKDGDGSAMKCAMNGTSASQQIKDLHDWHNVSDAEGVKTWYVRRSMTDATAKLATDMSEVKELLRQLLEEQKRMNRSIDKSLAEEQ